MRATMAMWEMSWGVTIRASTRHGLRRTLRLGAAPPPQAGRIRSAGRMLVTHRILLDKRISRAAQLVNAK